MIIEGDRVMFKQGDIVEAFGCRGVVTEINSRRDSVYVLFEGIRKVPDVFLPDGKAKIGTKNHL